VENKAFESSMIKEYPVGILDKLWENIFKASDLSKWYYD